MNDGEVANKFLAPHKSDAEQWGSRIPRLHNTPEVHFGELKFGLNIPIFGDAVTWDKCLHMLEK